LGSSLNGAVFMIDRNLARGFFLILISLAFGLQSLRYPLGSFEAIGPGLFPLVISSLLLVIGIATAIAARFAVKAPLQFNVKSIGLIVGSLIIFAMMSQYVDMLVGIVVLVLCASYAAKPYSIFRNVKIAAVLIAIALAFQKLLGLELPLY
jgi:hypothetical protein